MSQAREARRGHYAGRAKRSQNDSPEVRLSKTLSYILRHGAAKEGLKMREDGSVLVSELQKCNNLRGATFEQIKQVVDTNDKQRFALFEEKDKQGRLQWFIRATQGHSIDLEEPRLVLLTAATMPKEVIHGTTKDKIALIREKGLSRMQRTHIHFASGLFGDKGVVSGMRATSNVFIYIDTAKALQDGIEFYLSDNNVVLSKGLENSGVIPAKYFEKIVSKD
ncbi:tRNA 2'-phosphotransferase [Coemansia sp. RSA 2599]|nr:tRNA 2'-phosphotransferase [Coemansia sp. RSA 2598]KAJ1828957.1 tRNA 2'-phosphotransferase [Coemansia sp. RSA 2599]